MATALTEKEFETGFVERVGSWYRYTPEQLGDIYQAIKFVDAEQLEKGITALLETSTYKPKIAEIRKALGLGRKFGGSTGGMDLQEKWRLEDEADRLKVEAYCDSFMETDSLALEAKAEGWDNYLENFARLTAGTMQQMISRPTKGYGWSSLAVPSDFVYVYRNLLKQCSSRIRSGGINVLLALPDMAPVYWCNLAMRQKPAPSAVETKFEQHCNAIIERLRNEREKAQA